MIAAGNSYQLSPIAVVIIGACIVCGGVLLLFLGKRLTSGLNRLYATLPGRMKYPPWFALLLGWIFIGFGLLVAVLGFVSALRS
jgi:hypothetical protein